MQLSATQWQALLTWMFGASKVETQRLRVLGDAGAVFAFEGQFRDAVCGGNHAFLCDLVVGWLVGLSVEWGTQTGKYARARHTRGLNVIVTSNRRPFFVRTGLAETW